MYECFHCGARAVVWDADFDASDYGYERPGVIHERHCMNCGALITYTIFTDGDEDGEDRPEK